MGDDVVDLGLLGEPGLVDEPSAVGGATAATAPVTEPSPTGSGEDPEVVQRESWSSAARPRTRTLLGLVAAFLVGGLLVGGWGVVDGLIPQQHANLQLSHNRRAVQLQGPTTVGVWIRNLGDTPATLEGARYGQEEVGVLTRTAGVLAPKAATYVQLLFDPAHGCRDLGLPLMVTVRSGHGSPYQEDLGAVPLTDRLCSYTGLTGQFASLEPVAGTTDQLLLTLGVQVHADQEGANGRGERIPATAYRLVHVDALVLWSNHGSLETAVSGNAAMTIRFRIPTCTEAFPTTGLIEVEAAYQAPSADIAPSSITGTAWVDLGTAFLARYRTFWDQHCPS